MPRRVFTPTAIELIRELASQGKSAAAIAGVIGSTAASVRVKCCELKIKLSRRARPSLLRGWLHHNGEQKLVVFLRPADYAALRQKAACRQKSAVELAEKLLQAIISSNLYEAVLDDDDVGDIAASPKDAPCAGAAPRPRPDTSRSRSVRASFRVAGNGE